MAKQIKDVTREELLKALQLTVDNDLQLGETLRTRVAFALKAEKAKKVEMRLPEDELRELTKETMKAVKALTVPANVENSPKLTPKTEPEPKSTESKTTGKKTVKKSAAKTPAPKPEAPKPEVKTAPQPTTKNGFLPIAKIFPATIETKDLGKLVAVPNKFHTYKELFDALVDNQTVYFASYWTPRHIKEFSYGLVYDVDAPKNFPNDLDLALAVVPCETKERVWVMSRYTEAMSQFTGGDLAPVKDKDPATGEEFQIRVSNGLEFELYIPSK